MLSTATLRRLSLGLLAAALVHGGASAQDTVLEQSTLPILEIETQLGLPIVDGFLREADLAIYDTPGALNRLTDTPEAIPGKIYVEFRGSSSLNYPKKGYGFEMRDSATQRELKLPLFGMPEHDDWALHGPYADKTLMRNALAYGWARSFTDWAPRARFVEVVVNGSYEGIYLFTEKVRQDNDRVDIARLDASNTGPNSITGGYLLQVGIDAENEYRSFFSDYSQVIPGEVYTQFRLDYPRYDSLGAGQFAYIEDYVHGIEARMVQPDYANARDGYRNYVDVASWVDHAILQELTGNFDAFRRSLYVQKDRDDRGGRFAAGPVWDFNIALGNEESCLGEDVAGWMMESNGPACDFRSLPFFVQRMFADPIFKARMRARWEGLRQNALSDARLLADVDSLAALLAPAQPQDQARWQHLGTYVWPNPQVSDTYAEEVAYLRDWLQRRVAWIDQAIANWPRVQTFQPNATHLPIVRIDVPGGDTIRTDDTAAELRVINNGPDQVNSPQGSATGYLGPVGVEIAGNADNKRHYELELRDAAGDDYAYRLLDMPKESDWVLRGPYSDKSLVREALAFSLADATTEYAPRFEPVVLYVNDDYEGIYVLTERIKRDDSRVDIAKLRPDENSGDDLTGGYIVELDGDSDDADDGFRGAIIDDVSGEPAFYSYHTPKARDITPTQRAYIRDFVRGFEQAVANGNVGASADLESLADYMLVQELAANSKAYRRSTYLVKDKDSNDPRLRAGPVWDLNRGFGNDVDCGGQSAEGWVAELGGRCADDYAMAPWWRTLWADRAFRDIAAQRWRQYRADVYSDDALRARVTELTDAIRDETDANFARYPILGQAVGRNAFVGATYDEEVDYLRDWLLARAEWMDANLATINPPDSTREPLGGLGLRIWPNPASSADVVTVRWDGSRLPEGDKFEVVVVDALARSTLAYTAEGPRGRLDIDVADLARGMYYVRLRVGGRIVSAQALVR